jgi:hypothetical protein
MHRVSENEEHCKNENKCQICTVYQKMMSMAKPTISQTFVSSKCWRPLLEILESNSWRGVGHAPTPSYSKAIHRANQQEHSIPQRV